MPKPIITLTTDFGHRGPFVGIMKGVILSRLSNAKIVDLTHEVEAHWPAEAGFWLAHSYQYFPLGTVHVAVVDPGVGTERDILCCELNGHIFLAPDNGILSDVIGLRDDILCYRLSAAMLQRLNPGTISSTFHGRDVFAPLAAELAGKRLSVSEVGEATRDMAPSLVERAERVGQRLQGTIVAVDRFGNLISNVNQAQLEQLQKPVITCSGRELELQDTYGRSRPGELLALINSFGMLEIARVESSAAEYLGLGIGAPISVAERRD
jgi:S-adenosyl-L-methionine hydrolase (adenosine-forming)